MMGVPDVEQAKRRLQDILGRANQLHIPTKDVISMRTAQKLLARTKDALAWTIILGAFLAILTGFVYIQWPITQEIETVRTVLRRTCGGGSTSGEFSERVAALLHSSTTQDDC